MSRRYNGLIGILGLFAAIAYAAGGAADILLVTPQKRVPGVSLDQIYWTINNDPAAGSMLINYIFVGVFAALTVLMAFSWMIASARRQDDPELRIMGYFGVLAIAGALYFIATLPMTGDVNIAFLTTSSGFSWLGLLLLAISGASAVIAGVLLALFGRDFISIWN